MDDFPVHLRRFLPNIYYSGNREMGNRSNYLKLVALIATKDIHAGAELFSTYYTMVYD